MASFREQFEESFGAIPDYSPIRPQSTPGIARRAALDLSGAFPGGKVPDADPYAIAAAALGEMPTARKPGGETSFFSDTAKNLAAGVVDVGAMATGALEYAGRQTSLGGTTDIGRRGVEAIGDVRRGLTGLSQDITASMSPEAIERLSREWTTLDPNRTIWQGSPQEAVSSIWFQFTRSLPSTVSTLLPGMLWMKAGLGAAGITYLGASEAILSTGAIANNVATEIESLTPEQLAQIPAYTALLEKTNDPDVAKQMLITEAQGAVPLAAGALVGAISAAAGRYLEPRLTGTTLGQRVRAGAISEGLFQEAPQSGIERFMQNVAAQTYDANRQLSQGVLEDTVSGGAIGGISGGAFNAIVGTGPQAPAQEEPPAPPAAAIPPAGPPVSESGEPLATMYDVFGQQPETQVADQNFLDYRRGRDAQISPPPPRRQAPGNDWQTRANRTPPQFTDPALMEDVSNALRQAGLMDELPLTMAPDEQGRRMPISPVGPWQAPPTSTLTDAERYGPPAPTPRPPGSAPEQLPLMPSIARNEDDTPNVPMLTGFEPGGPMAGSTDESFKITVRDPQGNVREEFTARNNMEVEDVLKVVREIYPNAYEGANARGPTNDSITVERIPGGALDTSRDTSLPPGAIADERQGDLFGGTTYPSTETSSFPGEERRTNYNVSVTDPSRDELLFDQDYPSRTEADRAYYELAPWHEGLNVERGSRSTVTNKGKRAADIPTAEPLSDIEGQLDELENPTVAPARQAVYLPPSTVAALNNSKLSDRVRNKHVVLADFDGKGGMLIVLDRAAAERAMAMRNSGMDMQEILGRLTGTGVGKPADGQWVAQLRDDKGRVIRDTLTSTREEAEALATEWGDNSYVLPVRNVLERRDRLVRAEASRSAADRAKAADDYNVARTVEEYNLPYEEEQQIKRAGRDAGAARLALSAADETSDWSHRYPRPEELEFKEERHQRRYRKAYIAWRKLLAKRDSDESKAMGGDPAVESELNTAEAELARVLRMYSPGVIVPERAKAATKLSPNVGDTLIGARGRSKRAASYDWKQLPEPALTPEPEVVSEEELLNLYDLASSIKEILPTDDKKAAEKKRKYNRENKRIKDMPDAQYAAVVDEARNRLDDLFYQALDAMSGDRPRSRAKTARGQVQALPPPNADGTAPDPSLRVFRTNADGSQVEVPYTEVYEASLKRAGAAYEGDDTVGGDETVEGDEGTTDAGDEAVDLRSDYEKLADELLGEAAMQPERQYVERELLTEDSAEVPAASTLAEESDGSRRAATPTGINWFEGADTSFVIDTGNQDRRSELISKYGSQPSERIKLLRRFQNELRLKKSGGKAPQGRKIYSESANDEQGGMTRVSRTSLGIVASLDTKTGESRTELSAEQVRAKREEEIRRLEAQGASPDTIARLRAELAAAPVIVTPTAPKPNAVFSYETIRADSTPQDESRAQRAVRMSKSLEAIKGLDKKISAAERFLAQIEKARAWADARNNPEVAKGLSYFRSMIEYAKAASNIGHERTNTASPHLGGTKNPTGGNGLSLRAISEFAAVAKWLEKYTGAKSDVFSSTLANMLRAETRESRSRIWDDKQREQARALNWEEKTREESAAHVREMLRSRYKNEWPKSKLYREVVGPLVKKFTDSIARDGWPSYTPSINELVDLRDAFATWNTQPDRETLYSPLREFFQIGLGFPFNEAGTISLKVELVGAPNEVQARRLREYMSLLDPTARTPRMLLTKEGESGLITVDKTTGNVEYLRPGRQLEGKARAKAEGNYRDTGPFQRRERLNDVLQKYIAVVNNPKTTLDAMAKAEAAMIKHVKELGFWQDVPGTAMFGRIVAPGTVINLRLIGEGVKSRRLSKTDARRVVNAIESKALGIERGADAIPAENTLPPPKAPASPLYGKLREIFKALTGDPVKDVAVFRQALDYVAKNSNDPANRALAQRFKLLLARDKGVQFRVLPDAFGVPGNVRPFDPQAGYKSGVLIELSLNSDFLTDESIVHEAGHAVTVRRFGRLRNAGNTPEVTALKRLYETLLDRFKKDNPEEHARIKARTPAPGKSSAVSYGMSNIDEFFALGLNNKAFRSWLSEQGFGVDSALTEFLQNAKNVIRRTLGLPPARSKSALDQFDAAVENILRLYERTEAGSAIVGSGGTGTMQLPSFSEMDPRLLTATERGRAQMETVSRMAREGKAPLALTTLDQVYKLYSKYFEGADGANPMKDHMSGLRRRMAETSRLREIGEQQVRKWSELMNGTDAQRAEATEVSRVMTLASLYQINVTEPVTSEANKHLKSAEQKERHAELQARFNALSPQGKELYTSTRQYYRDAIRDMQALSTMSSLRAVLTGGNDAAMSLTEFERTFKFEDLQGMKPEKLREKLKALKVDDDVADEIIRMARVPSMVFGDYAPLSRDGEYVVYADAPVEEREFDAENDAIAYATAMRQADPTYHVATSNTGGQWVVKVSQPDFRMFDSEVDARIGRANMQQQYPGVQVSPPKLKFKFDADIAITSNSGLNKILQKLEGNAAAQNAIKEFYVRQLADESFRKHQQRRRSMLGVSLDRQARSFAQYSEQFAFYAAQLRYGWKMAKGLSEMKAFVRDKVDESDISALRLSEVVSSIEWRDDAASNLRKLPALARAVPSFTQAMLLTTPSYWMLNASQPYMVYAPTAGAKYGVGKTMSSLARAQKLIGSPIIEAALKSAGGLRTLFGRKGKRIAEESYNVLGRVLNNIKNDTNLTAEQRRNYVEMIEDLRDNSIIDLSFVTELREMADGVDNNMRQRLLDASRLLSHLTEVNNRIMVALSAYQLEYDASVGSLGAEAAHKQAIEYAREAVSETQFNYSANNKPPLFQTSGPLGRMAPIMTQFMQYAQHMYALWAMNIQAAWRGDKTAKKALAYLATTHLAGAGMVGLMFQPLKIVIGAILAAGGDDDDVYDWKGAITGKNYDRAIELLARDMAGDEIGSVIARGLPTAIGIDLSKRLAAGNLIFLDLDSTSTNAMVGSLFQSFGGASVGLASSFIDGAMDLARGEPWKAAEKLSPKFLRDAIKTVRYAEEGLTTRDGATIVRPEQFSAGNLLATSIGFTPEMVTRTYNVKSYKEDLRLNQREWRTDLTTRIAEASPSDVPGLIEESLRYTKAFPGDPIRPSDILRFVRNRNDRELRYRLFGANIDAKAEATYGYRGNALR